MFNKRRFGGLMAAMLSVAASGCIDDGPDPNPNPASPSFHTAFRYPTGAGAFAVRSADLNADGRLDLVSANNSGNSVSVLLAGEGGGYALHTDYAAGTAPVALAIVDLDADGALDVVCANSGSATLSVFFGAGDGSFAEAVNLSLLASSSPLDVIAVDLDGDTSLDLVAADSATNTLAIFMGPVGDPAAIPVFINVGTGPRAVLAADLNGDGAPDLVSTNRNSNNMTLMLNDGAGGFAPGVAVATGTNPRQAQAIDIDGDADLDLVVTNPGSSNITTHLNDGAGAFAPGVTIAVDQLPSRFVTGDFDGDGNTDLAALLFSNAGTNPSLGVVDVLFGNGSGGFPEFQRFGAGSAAQDIHAADLNADGRLDLITADSTRDAVYVLQGRGAGIYASDLRTPTGRQPREAVAVDLDRDGDLDLVVISQQDQRLRTYTNDGSGGFVERSSVALAGTPRGLAVGLLDGDENPDVAVTLLTGNQGVQTFLGKGDGTLLPTGGVTINLPGQGPRSVAIGDLNGDGKNDLVTGDGTADEISVMLANGSGGYAAPVAYASGNYPLNVSLTDANGDGKLDVVYLSRRDPDSPTDQAQPRAVRMLGKGDGTFDTASILRVETGAEPADLVLGDISGDGKADAVVASPAGNAAFTHVIRTDGFILPGTSRFAGPGARAIALAATGSGLGRDIITVNSDNTFTVIENIGSGSFSGQTNYNAGSGAVEIVPGDFNKDGKTDLVLLNQTTNDLSLVLGR